jgi:hypothetical protein
MDDYYDEEEYEEPGSYQVIPTNSLNLKRPSPVVILDKQTASKRGSKFLKCTQTKCFTGGGASPSRGRGKSQPPRVFVQEEVPAAKAKRSGAWTGAEYQVCAITVTFLTFR